ncbi:hypothetical protein BpsS140_00004 [Bacillus phage vB_BpsS-140]|nr:hypothetical protein BpsS140_00004 [Bacillus phage vB_BpsS-140]
MEKNQNNFIFSFVLSNKSGDDDNTVYRVRLLEEPVEGEEFSVEWDSDDEIHKTTYTIECVNKNIKNGNWLIVNEIPQDSMHVATVDAIASLQALLSTSTVAITPEIEGSIIAIVKSVYMAGYGDHRHHSMEIISNLFGNRHE